MRFAYKFFIYLVVFIVILFGILYFAVNSSFVFNKAAGHFAPEYNIRYDKVSGNAISGLKITGLYYKDKKLAREIRIKINPVTLLKKKITVSRLELSEVDEAHLEYMMSDFSDDSDDNSSTEFPFSVVVKNAKLSMLPFEISNIKSENLKSQI